MDESRKNYEQDSALDLTALRPDLPGRNEKGELLLYNLDGSAETVHDFYARQGYIDNGVDDWR